LHLPLIFQISSVGFGTFPVIIDICRLPGINGPIPSATLDKGCIQLYLYNIITTARSCQSESGEFFGSGAVCAEIGLYKSHKILYTIYILYKKIVLKRSIATCIENMILL
jgi:hypothetical protein